MKRYLVLAFAALGVALVAPSAFATHVIFDPPAGVIAGGPSAGTDCTVPGPFTVPCNVSKLNVPYLVPFLSCNDLTGLVPAVHSGWCLFMTNVSAKTLNTFTFEFTAPNGGSASGDSLSCSSRPPGFATDNCQDGTTVSAGDILNLSFYASLPNNTNFYLITDFVNQPGPATVTVSVPEPGALGMFGLGLLVLGVGFGWQKRRQAQTSRSNQAA